MRRLLSSLFAAVLAVAVALPGWAQSDPPTFSNEQLDQLLAPIALYPDSLLTQVLMAATYPAQVAEAVDWSKAHPNDKGDAAVEKVAGTTDWEPSVQSLVAFPEVINIMGQKPEWVQDLGDAFLAQPTETMDSVQRLRKLAQDAGQLQSNEQQKVVVQQATPQQSVIVIEPAQPQVVYVPAYNPTVVYGTWPYPTYPPYYMPPPYGYYPGSALLRGMAFGAGLAITNSLWGGYNWGRNDVNINVNRYNNVNVSRKISNTNNNFNHNNRGRKGVPYRDNKVNAKYGKNVAGKDARNDYRGRGNSRDAQRDAARQTMEKRVDPQARDKLQRQAGERPGAQDRTAAGRNRPGAGAEAKDRMAGTKNRQPGAGNAQRPSPASRDNALKGAGNGNAERAQVNRGQASRQASRQAAARPRPAPAARAAPAARPSPAARPAPAARGGGGGGHGGGGGGGHRGR